MLQKNETNYFCLAQEYFDAAQMLLRTIEKVKKNGVERRPGEKNEKIVSLRCMYHDCLLSGSILLERAEKYEQS